MTLTTTPTPTGVTYRPTRRVTALAALLKAVTYVVGFAVMGAYLAPRGFAAATTAPAGSLDFLRANATALYLWYLVLYVVGGLALVWLVIGIDARLREAGAGTGAAASRAIGLVWAGLLLASGLVALVGQAAVIRLASADYDLAVSTWTATSVVQDALGGGIEIVGAVWVLLVSIAGLRTAAVGRGPGILGVLVAVAGATTIVPAAADDAGAAFGLGLIVWFIWSAVTLLRSVPTDPVRGIREGRS